MPCDHLEFESVVVAQDDEVFISFQYSSSRLVNVKT